MNDLIGSIVSAVVLLLVALFGGGAVALNLSRRKSDKAENAFVEKEKHLEETDPSALVDSSPRADDLRDRRAALAESVRKRIRDRSRSVVSRGSGDGSTPSS